MDKKENQKRVEIFSIVDSLEGLRAAVSAGTDSVAFDVMQFQGEEAYGLSQIEYAVAFSRAFGKDVYASIDQIIKNSELASILEIVHQSASAGVDGFLVSDLAIAELIKKEISGIRIVLSERNAITNSLAASMSPSADRLIVAKELSRDDVMQLSKKCGKELQMQVYSEQCFSYTGKCYLGSFLYQKSANRNRCRKLCRKAFRKGSSLSQRDLLLINQIPDIISLGIGSISLKLVSKEAQFIYAIVAIFRRAVDSYYEGAFQIADMESLYLLLEGSATEGYFGRWRDPFIAFRKGIPLGQVIDNELLLLSSLKKGDMVKMVRGDNERLSRISFFMNRGNRVEEASKGDKVSLKFSNFRNGCNVYKIASKSIELDYPKIAAEMRITLKEGKYPEVLIRCMDLEVKAKGRKKVEKASKAPLDPMIIRQNLSRVSNTPFSMDKIDIDMDEGVILQYSELNKIKREALRSLFERFLGRKEVHSLVLPGTKEISGNNHAELYVHAYDMEGVIAAHRGGADLIYYDIFSNDVSDVLDYGKEHKIPIFLSTPGAVHESGMHHMVKLIEHYSPLGILVEDSGLLSDKIKAKKHIHYAMNLSNDIALLYWKHDAMVSVELNMSELISFKDKNFILFAHGNMRLMLSKKESRYPQLLLKNGRKIAALRNPYGQTIIMDSQKIMLLDQVEMLHKAGIRRFYLDLPEDVEETIVAYRQVLDGKKQEFVDAGMTKGHLNRGV